MIDTKEIEERVYQCDGRRNMLPLISIAHECIDHIDSLQDEIQMMNSYLNANAEIIAMNQRTIDAQAEEIKRLREALQFYADCEHYERMADGQLFVIETGDIARAALKPEEAPCQK